MNRQTENNPVPVTQQGPIEQVEARTEREDREPVLSFAAAMSHAEEREHVRAIEGDAESIDKVWRRHRRWVAAILLAHKPRWADVDDLLQEVAVAVVRKIGDVRDPRAVRPWLRTVAVNVAAAAARSGARRAKDVQGDDTLTPVVSEDDVERRHEISQGRRLLELAAELPEGYREPLLLKAVHNLSYREIGHIMELPETTIETRIARGRRQLRELASSAGVTWTGVSEIKGSSATEASAGRIKA